MNEYQINCPSNSCSELHSGSYGKPLEIYKVEYKIDNVMSVYQSNESPSGILNNVPTIRM